MTDSAHWAPRLIDRLNWVAEVLDSLPLTEPHRRAALLAVAQVAYRPETPVTDYATALVALDDEKLEELADAARVYKDCFPNLPDDPMPEDVRVRYLADTREVAGEIESDEDLDPLEQRHFKNLAHELIRALEAAPREGSKPVETAAKAVAGDLALNKPLWRRLATKPWAKKLAQVAAALIMLIGSYSSGKELASDAWTWFGELPALTAAQRTAQPPPVDAADLELEGHEEEGLPGNDPGKPQ